MKKAFFFKWILLSILLLSSCDDGAISPSKHFSAIDMATRNFNSSVYGFLYSTKTTYMNEESNQSSIVHHAYFYDNSKQYVAANYVSLNGNEITQVMDDDFVEFDGYTEHIWNVVGNHSIPSYLDSIRALNTFLIVSPSPMQTISKNAGVTINYDIVDGIDSVIIFVEFNKKLSSTIDTNYWYSQTTIKDGLVLPNTGTISLPSSFFDKYISNTYIDVEIIGIRKKVKTISGKDFITACLVSCRTNYLLQ